MAFLRRAVASFHPLVRRVPPELRKAVLDRAFQSREHNFIYFRVPKSANSTIMMSLADAMAGHVADSRGSAAKTLGKTDLKLDLVFARAVKHRFKFTFVRNPLSRVLSAYLDKVVSGNARIRADLGMDDRETLSFPEFLERLDQGYLTANIHWAPQARIVPLPPSELDFVGRVENLESDLQDVTSRIFGSAKRSMTRRTEGITSASIRLDEFYGPQERALVMKMYSEDLALFYPGWEW